jgi:hypothetical protein
MSTLTALARAQAVARRKAQPTCTVRHVHVSDRPLVLIPLALAGEANAPLAAMVGDDPASPRLLVVTQPRNRDQRFAFAAALAQVIVGYMQAFCSAVETVPSGPGREPRQRSADAPQILMPNPDGIGFVRLLGRSTRFRRPSGDYAVDPAVPVLGRWLSFLQGRDPRASRCPPVHRAHAPQRPGQVPRRLGSQPGRHGPPGAPPGARVRTSARRRSNAMEPGQVDPMNPDAPVGARNWAVKSMPGRRIDADI